MARKPDDDVGESGTPSVGGGHQTAQQAAITGQGPGQEEGGRTDADRNASWGAHGGTPGRAPTSVGGSSEGHSDQQAGQGAREDEKVAGGLYRTERTGGKTDG